MSSMREKRDNPLVKKEFWDVSAISGPLVFLKVGERFPVGAVLEVHLPSGERRLGQILETSRSHAVMQVLEGSHGLDVQGVSVSLKDQAARIAVGPHIIGRRFDGLGRPTDGLPPIPPEKELDIAGEPLNPLARARPTDFIETGLSAIDGFNTLVRGQKLPIFSGSGLPANEVALHIVQHAAVRGETDDFLVVFAAMGITAREVDFFTRSFEQTERGARLVAFVNKADDPPIERLFTPRCALTAAEYLAFDLGYHVLVVMTDMTNYCDALRQVAGAREEVPGRRGYPGYMYTDLATLYERAARIQGKKGSVTLIPILTMPDDDITHPIPDLTGYITEGQVVLDRGLHRKGIFPPVDVLASLSRLMNNGIGEGLTRKDHRQLADQLYACYAHGHDIRKLTAIVGEDALSDIDRNYLEFADVFENEMIGQGPQRRTIDETLDIGWRILATIPKEQLTRLNKDLIDRYYSEIMEDGSHAPHI